MNNNIKEKCLNYFTILIIFNIKMFKNTKVFFFFQKYYLFFYDY